MGQAIIAEIAAVTAATLAGGAERDGHPLIGKSIAPNLVCCGNAGALAHQSQVLVDFTSPAALDANIEAACEAGCALVIGTTGLKPEHHAAIDRAGRHIAILQAANTSLGVNVLAALVERATAALGPDWDVEIVEMHHRHKIDAPSGTALALGEAAAKGRGVDLGKVAERGRDGDAGPRAKGAIGFASLRGGSVAGDHMVVLAADGERIELGHRAETREIFARGAVRAALWLAGRPAGRYGMNDVLGL
jgi:4-hydroxy-tetrahydrodipicolinate reductase